MLRVFIGFTVLLSLLVACSGTNFGNGSFNQKVYSDAASLTLPVYMKMKMKGYETFMTNWTWGSPVFEIYQVFTQDDRMGYFNLYDLLKTSDWWFSNCMVNGSGISEQAIDSPVELGFNGNAEKATYNRMFYETSPGHTNRVYVRASGGKYFLLHLCVGAGTAGLCKGIVQGYFDTNTGNLELAMSMMNPVQNTGSSYIENIRVLAVGNVKTSQFSMKLIRDGIGCDYCFVGYGIAKGVGNKYLMKFANNTLWMSNTNQVAFYSFQADALADELKPMRATNAPTAETAAYESKLPEPYTPNDLIAQSAIPNLDFSKALHK